MLCLHICGHECVPAGLEQNRVISEYPSALSLQLVQVTTADTQKTVGTFPTVSILASQSLRQVCEAPSCATKFEDVEETHLHYLRPQPNFRERSVQVS
jgi:hypothetical protein